MRRSRQPARRAARTDLRVAFAGTPEFALPALEALRAQHHVVGVLTQPDRPSGRGRHLTREPGEARGARAGLPLAQPPTLASDTARTQLALWAPDVLVVVAYGLLLPRELLALPRFGCLNIHASLLPRWRGAAPIQRALLAGDAETGVSIMQMEAGLDTGPLLLQRRLAIEPGATAGSLQEALARLGAAALIEVLAALEAGTQPPPVPQSAAGVTYAAKILKAEARIDWTAEAPGIERQVRAFNPWPVAETSLEGAQLRILRRTGGEYGGTWPRKCGEKTRSWGYRRIKRRINDRPVRLGKARGHEGAAGRRQAHECRRPRPRHAARRPRALARTPWAPGAPALAAAASVVEAVIERGESADAALDARAPASARCAPWPWARCAGTCGLPPRSSRCSPGPPECRGRCARSSSSRLIRCEYSRNAPESVVHTAVDAARLLRQVKSTGLVNAVLRRFVAERAALLERVDATPAGRTAHPRWLVERIGAAWGERTEAILAANNARAPMALRVDLSRTSAPDYVASLAGAGIDAHPLQWMPSAVILERPDGCNEAAGVPHRRGLRAGCRRAACRAAAGRPPPGMRVLDACAAPGGKTGHLLERPRRGRRT